MMFLVLCSTLCYNLSLSSLNSTYVALAIGAEVGVSRESCNLSSIADLLSVTGNVTLAERDASQPLLQAMFVSPFNADSLLVALLQFSSLWLAVFPPKHCN